MDFQSAMETFAEAWVAANAGQQTQALALTRSKTPKDEQQSPPNQELRSPRERSRSPKYRPSSNASSTHANQEQLPTTAIANTPTSTPNYFGITKAAATGSNAPIITENGTAQSNNSPPVDRKDFDFSKVNSKSLPLHCIVESVASLQSSLSTDARGPWKRRSNIEMDSYVIVPAVTQFCNIVNTALQRLGYSPETSQTARGSIVIKNWKPLALEKICDSPLVTVGDVLGELTSVITLRIVILRTKPSTLSEIKDKLLRLLILQSHALLRSSGCPLDEITLSQLCRSNTFQSPFPFSAEAADDIRRKFDSWWSSQLSPQTNPLAHKLLPFVNPPTASMDFSKTADHLHASHDVMLENHHQPHHNMIVHPALQTVHSQYPSQKTRMRTSFDPEMELPKLQRWFQENPHPSRQQIQSYVIQLNALESRRGRKPLDVNNVVYWFKNARAAQKRAELRGQSMSNGFSGTGGLMMSQGGYMKSPHSIPSEDIDNLSQHSDDLDDDLDRPPSPQLPLSLTTHERNRSPASDERDSSSVKVERDSPPSKPQNGASEQASVDSVATNHNSTNHTQDSRSDSPKTSPKSEDLDMEDSDVNPMEDFRSPSPDSRRDLPFPMVPNSMFSHSIMYMSHYIPTAMGQNPHHPQQQSLSPSSIA
uniref:Putative satb1 matrix attachment region binding protein n=1 Tax=Nyssomyia neivai TaxID=330878 RepID=A0A1L8DG31_9DIPT